jgi:hypothetical protein
VGGDGTPQRVLANDNATLQRVRIMGNHKMGYRALRRVTTKGGARRHHHYLPQQQNQKLGKFLVETFILHNKP